MDGRSLHGSRGRLGSKAPSTITGVPWSRCRMGKRQWKNGRRNIGRSRTGPRLGTLTVDLRRRHQARTPPLARIRPGSPAPAIGAGTDTKLTSAPNLTVSASPALSAPITRPQRPGVEAGRAVAVGSVAAAGNKAVVGPDAREHPQTAQTIEAREKRKRSGGPA